MKKIVPFLTLFLICSSAFAQNIAGEWNGILNVQAMQIRLVFHISETETGLKAEMDSPDQGALGIPVDKISFENSELKMEIQSAGIVYTGTFEDNRFTGTFTQYGREFPLNLTREQEEKQPIRRPQEPEKPYPYHSEDITFHNEEAGITLAGTLTFPKTGGSFVAAVLITGSGPQNRDEEILGHKPFLVISDYLTRNGIAVLRFDDRGVAESEGDFQSATTYDFVTDVISAVQYLKTRNEIDPHKIGLIGHSEGGIIAPIAASKYPDDISFIVLLAGTGIRGDKLMLMQQELIGRAVGFEEEYIQQTLQANKKAFDMVRASEIRETLINDITDFVRQAMKDDPPEIPSGMTEEEYLQLQVSRTTSPWMIEFIRLDPAYYLEKVKCPVLAVNGENDLQVPAKENLSAIKTALNRGGNSNVTIKEFPGLNHLFQSCDTGNPNLYAQIEETFSLDVLIEIAVWINGELNK